MKNDGFYNSNFNKILKYVEFHKHRVSRMILKIICHFLIDSSNEKEPDLNNNVTGLEPNADIFSFRHENSGQVSQTSNDGKSYKDLTNETIETDDTESESGPTMLTICGEENEIE